MWSDTNEEMNNLTVLSKQQANCSLFIKFTEEEGNSLWWDQKFLFSMSLLVSHHKDAVIKKNKNNNLHKDKCLKEEILLSSKTWRWMVIFKMSSVCGHFLDYKDDLTGPFASSCSFFIQRNAWQKNVFLVNLMLKWCHLNDLSLDYTKDVCIHHLSRCTKRDFSYT